MLGSNVEMIFIKAYIAIAKKKKTHVRTKELPG